MDYLKIFILAALVCAACASLSDEFDIWSKKYGKTYASEAERDYRMKVFAENKEKIAKMNSENSDATFGLNVFADQTYDELVATRTSKTLRNVMEEVKKNVVVAPPARDDLPDYFDWNDKGAVTPVKDQGSCGSCFSFGALATLEGQLFIKQGKLVNLSEQNIVDCDHECQMFPSGKICDYGCDGGMEMNVYQYVIKNGGVDTYEDYPYTASEGYCKFDPSIAIGGFTNWTYVKVNQEDDLRQYLYDNGPVALGVHADEWFYYSGGVFSSYCGTQSDHAVLLTGWGDDNGTPYWSIKNSWGLGWGIKGYIHLLRGKNMCGMLGSMSQGRMD